MPQIFLGNVGRLNEYRFSKYYCYKCVSEYSGSPLIRYENPNEELGEGLILIEKGEYKSIDSNSTDGIIQLNNIKFSSYMINETSIAGILLKTRIGVHKTSTNPFVRIQNREVNIPFTSRPPTASASQIFDSYAIPIYHAPTELVVR